MKIANLVATTFASLLSLPLVAQESAVSAAPTEESTPASADKLTAESDGQIPAAVPPSRAGGGKGGFGGMGMGGGAQWVGAATRTPASQVSVLCFKEPDQKELRETTEDIAVLAFLLSRNLDQAVSEDTSDYKLGIPMLLSANQAVGASYIQDFGALLKMQVRFPVAAPADGHVERKLAQAGSEWESARRELMDQDSGNDSFPPASNYTKRGAEGQPYDPTLVQTLQKRILALLKNAANIRHLKGNEWVIVKVVGTPTSSIITRVVDDQPAGSEPADPSSESKPAPPSRRSPRYTSTAPKFARADAVPAQNQTTVLTLRVKKSDADAFAAGSLSEERFIQTAEVAAYFNPAPNDTDTRNVAYEGLRK
jgi:hypothetical protein